MNSFVFKRKTPKLIKKSKQTLTTKIPYSGYCLLFTLNSTHTQTRNTMMDKCHISHFTGMHRSQTLTHVHRIFSMTHDIQSSESKMNAYTMNNRLIDCLSRPYSFPEWNAYMHTHHTSFSITRQFCSVAQLQTKMQMMTGKATYGGRENQHKSERCTWKRTLVHWNNEMHINVNAMRKIFRTIRRPLKMAKTIAHRYTRIVIWHTHTHTSSELDPNGNSNNKKYQSCFTQKKTMTTKTTTAANNKTKTRTKIGDQSM